jgi:hypothetical protein
VRHPPFTVGNTIGKAGKPRGTRNRLASHVFEDLLQVWNEPIKEGSDITRGKAALRIMSREKPADFAKLYAGVMPKEFVFENVVNELSDEDRRFIMEMLYAKDRQDMLLDDSRMKVIEHVN